MEPSFAPSPLPRPPNAAAAPFDLDPASIPEIDLYTLDDLPLAYLPMAGQTILSISFGVGRAHEPVVQGGLTHLAEHLIMNKVTDAFDHSNGATEPFRVTFITRGTPASVTRFLRDVCEAINRPPLGRMHEEANVLRTEAAGRGGMGFSFRLSWLRTGYRGLGCATLPEFFLRALDEDVLRRWIGDHLVAGNAQIWIAGELPDDLLVDLPAGERTPPPRPEWIAGLRTPALYVEDAPGVGMGFIAPRSAAVATAFRVLDRRLKQALRVKRGLAYEVATEYLPVGPKLAMANIWCTCLPAVVRDVEGILLEAVDDMAHRGASEEELEDQYQELVRQALDPLSIPGRLDAYARDALFGARPETMAKLIDDQWRLRPDHVAAAFRSVCESMIFLLPPTGSDPQRPLHAYPPPPADPPGHGRSFDFVAGKGPRPWSRPTTRACLSIGDQGLAIDDPRGGRLVGIPWRDCVAVVREGDGRSILGVDGEGVTIRVGEWRDGAHAVGLIDRVAPPDTMVPAGP